MRSVIICIVHLLPLLTVKIVESCSFEPVPMSDIMDAAYASKAAYKELGKGNLIPNTTFEIKKVVIDSYKSESVKLIIAETSSTVIVAFRGTKGILQLGAQFYDVWKNMNGENVQFGTKKVKVSAYFWGAYKLLKGSIKDDPIMSRQGKRYIITGHSLGGAMAALMALDWETNRKSVWSYTRSALITFGEPRVGMQAFVDLHDQFIPRPRKLRVVNKHDLVTHIPLYNLGYRQHGQALLMKGKDLWQVCGKTESLLTCGNPEIPLFNKKDHSLSRYIETLKSLPKEFTYCPYASTIICAKRQSLSVALQEACSKENFGSRLEGTIHLVTSAFLLFLLGIF